MPPFQQFQQSFSNTPNQRSKWCGRLSGRDWRCRRHVLKGQFAAKSASKTRERRAERRGDRSVRLFAENKAAA